jgi:hypothetical protein
MMGCQRRRKKKMKKKKRKNPKKKKAGRRNKVEKQTPDARGGTSREGGRMNQERQE